MAGSRGCKGWATAVSSRLSRACGANQEVVMAKDGRGNKQADGRGVEKRGGPLVLYIGRQGDGTVYSLGPLTEALLQETSPGVERPAFVHIGYPDNRDFDDEDLGAFEQFQRPFWPHVATLLTALTPEEIGELGGLL